MGSKISPSKDRGHFLTLMILVEGVFLPLYLLQVLEGSLLEPSRLAFMKQFPRWYQPVWIAEPFIILVILIGIWKWKRLAVYALFILLISRPLLYFIVSPVKQNPLTLSSLFIGTLLWIWAIKRKWLLFK